MLPVWQRYAQILRAEGYAVASPQVLHTEEYGVPQTRRRAILIARWTGEGRLLPGEPCMPEPTHGRYHKRKSRHDHGLGLQPWVSMKDVLAERDDPYTVVSNYGTGGDPKARGQRGSHEPSATVTGKISRNRIVGPDGQDRPRLTESEAGRLQTFPRYRTGFGPAPRWPNRSAMPFRLASACTSWRPRWASSASG